MLQTFTEDWNHVCEKQENACLGNVKRVCTLPQGKTLGGTSTINNLHYSRGNSRDFAEWKFVTNGKWEVDDIIAFYERIENFQRNEEDEFPIDYGRNGEIMLNRFKKGHFVKDMIIEAAVELKYTVIVSECYLGYTETLGTIQKGKRFNMAKAFLGPIKNRPNLFVARNTLATKVYFSNDKKALGIATVINGQKINIRARKEVILTGGPITTAKLLMNSGIGVAHELKKVGIHSISNVPTGKNFKAQIALPVYVAIDDVSKDISLNYETAKNMFEFLINNRGPYTQININDLIGYIVTKNTTSNYPDVQMYHSYFPPNDTALEEELFQQQYDFPIIRSILKFNRHRGLLLFKPTLLHPESTGEVLLTGYCPEKPVLIKGNFLTDKLNADIDMLVAAFKYVESTTQTQAFSAYHAELVQIEVPLCKNLHFYTDAYIKCYVRNMAYPRNGIGTAKMGYCPFDGVVDGDLNVFNTRGLRVVGASVMPTFVSGNIVGTVAMMGDKLSEMIKYKWIDDYVMFNTPMEEQVVVANKTATNETVITS